MPFHVSSWTVLVFFSAILLLKLYSTTFECICMCFSLKFCWLFFVRRFLASARIIAWNVYYCFSQISHGLHYVPVCIVLTDFNKKFLCIKYLHSLACLSFVAIVAWVLSVHSSYYVYNLPWCAPYARDFIILSICLSCAVADSIFFQFLPTYVFYQFYNRFSGPITPNTIPIFQNGIFPFFGLLFYCT